MPSSTYSSVHKWITYNFGQPKHCIDCKTTKAKKFEWANISGQYRRDISDWKRLCTKCHRKLDTHLQARGELINHSKLKTSQVIQIRNLYQSGQLSTIKLGKLFKVNTSSITRIVRRITWRHI